MTATDLFVMHPDASAMMGDGRVLVALHNADGAGYPAASDPEIVKIRINPAAGLANIASVFDIWSAQTAANPRATPCHGTVMRMARN